MTMHLIKGCVSTWRWFNFDLNRVRQMTAEPPNRISYAASCLRQKHKRKCKRTKDKLAGEASWPKWAKVQQTWQQITRVQELLTCNIIVHTTPDSLNFSAMDRGLRPKKVVNKIKACQRCQTCKCLRCSSRLVSAIKGPYDERRVSALHWARKAASNRAYLRAGSSYTTEERETRRWVQRAGADVIDSLMSQIIRHNK